MYPITGGHGSGSPRLAPTTVVVGDAKDKQLRHHVTVNNSRINKKQQEQLLNKLQFQLGNN